MARHSIKVVLTDNDEKFLKWALKDRLYGADCTSLQDIMRSIFYLQLREDRALYDEEAETIER